MIPKWSTAVAMILVTLWPTQAAALACLVEYASDEPTGGIYHIGPLENHSGRRLIGADSGLFRLEGDSLTRVAPEVSTGEIAEIGRFDERTGQHLIAAEGGLFRLKGGSLARVDPDAPTGSVRKLGPVDESTAQRLIAAQGGLFRLEGDSLTPVDPEVRTGLIWEIGPLDETTGQRLIGAEKGLFRLEDDSLTRVAPEVRTGALLELGPLDESTGLRLIAAQNGLFRLEADSLKPVDPEVRTGRIWEIGPLDETTGQRLIGAEKGLFRLEADSLTRVAPETSTGTILKIGPPDESGSGQHLIGTDSGLYRLEADSLTMLDPEVPTDWIRDIGPLDEATGRRLIAELDNLVGLRDAPIESDDVVAFERAVSASAGRRTLIEWTIAHECARVLREQDFRLVDADGRPPARAVGEVRSLGWDAERRKLRISAYVRFDERGTERVRIEVRDEAGFVPLGEPIQIRVDWGPFEFARYYLARFGPWALAAHAFVFAALVFGAGWSGTCFRVLADPLWGRAGIWLRSGLRNLAPLQRWLLRGWYHDRRSGLGPSSYLPMPLVGPSGERIASSDLVERLRRASTLWLQGNAGMGKTALVDQIARDYFGSADASSLGSAYRRFGFVLVVVRLRELKAIAPEPGKTECFVPELARAALRAEGLHFEDAELFGAMLRSGSFLIVLDGANEIAHRAELEHSAAGLAPAKVLVTSQTTPEFARDRFQTWRLPEDVSQAVRPLLELFLGSERGRRLYENVSATPLIHDIRSGYDVRLLADLAEWSERAASPRSTRLPSDRVGLYEAILDRVSMPGGTYPIDRLCRAAWELWCAGERKFGTGKPLGRELLAPLCEDPINVVRTLDGETYEFRHDQMHGYLAAKWAAVHEVSPESLFEQNAAIWRIGRTEQEVVWGFFAELVGADAGLRVWQWATLEPERAVLQHALQRRGEREGWKLTVATKPG